jgi:hypothetical protein
MVSLKMRNRLIRSTRNPKSGLAAIDVVVDGSHVAGDLQRINRQSQPPPISILSRNLRLAGRVLEKGSTVQVHGPVGTMKTARGRA